jgi:hypothetical protein
MKFENIDFLKEILMKDFAWVSQFDKHWFLN